MVKRISIQAESLWVVKAKHEVYWEITDIGEKTQCFVVMCSELYDPTL